jgi:1-acyl-sn-glycerol-3-phosphate acyltransferase
MLAQNRPNGGGGCHSPNAFYHWIDRLDELVSNANSGPGCIAPALVRHVLPVAHPLVRILHRATLDGFEHLPKATPYLLVANHSAGLGQAEILSFAVLYLKSVEARGESLKDRRLAGFAHPLAFRLPLFRSLMRAIGAIPSTYEDAEHALADGSALLVFPGGDHETLRPIWQAGLSDFGGRKGFLRIAKRAHVPIVPMGIAGSHFTAPVLLRSRLFAWALVVPRLLGLKRWAISLLGVMGAVAIALLPVAIHWRVIAIWLWLASPFVFTPFVPWTIRFRIGRPLSPQALFGPYDEELESAYRTVQGAVQDLMRPRA